MDDSSSHLVTCRITHTVSGCLSGVVLRQHLSLVTVVFDGGLDDDVAGSFSLRRKESFTSETVDQMK